MNKTEQRLQHSMRKVRRNTLGA